MTKIALSGAGSFQQKYLDGLEELVGLHRELSSLEAMIAERKQEILELKRNLSKKRKPSQSIQLKPAKKGKKSDKSDHLYWQDIVIQHIPDAYNALPPRKRQQIKESVYDFLRLKLDHEQIKKLEISNQEYDIPSRLIAPFVSWIKRQIAKITQNTPKRRISTGNKQNKKNETKPVKIWKTWAETIRQVLPTYRVESIHTHYAKSFLAQHASTIEKLKEAGNISSSSELCIPKELTETFLDEFFNKFPKIKNANVDLENIGPKGSILTTCDSAEKSLKITAWPDICFAIFPVEMERILSSLELEKNVSWSVGKFVAEKVNALNIEWAQCIVESEIRNIKTFGIPVSLESQFIGWFRGKLQTGFDEYINSMETIESGQGQLPLASSQENNEDSDLNSQELSGLLDQLVNVSDTRKDNTENIDPTEVSENNMLELLESIPSPSPIWSFSWLSESANEDTRVEKLPNANQAKPMADVYQKATNSTSKNSDGGKEKIIDVDYPVLLNLVEENNPISAQSINTEGRSDDFLIDFFNETPPISAAVSETSHLGSPVELSPDNSPEGVHIQNIIPLPDQSAFKTLQSGKSVADSSDIQNSAEKIVDMKCDEEVASRSEMEGSSKVKGGNVLIVESTKNLLSDESPIRAAHLYGDQLEFGIKNSSNDSGCASTTENIHSFSQTHNLIRYNSILLHLMPTYNSLSRSIRIEFKRKVYDFLVSELGERGADNCIIVRNAGKDCTTLGIPSNLEVCFKKLAVNFLRQNYGVKQVPFKPWELSLRFDFEEAFGSQCGLIMSLIRQVTESFRRFIRMRTIFINHALKSARGFESITESLEICPQEVRPGADHRQDKKEDLVNDSAIKSFDKKNCSDDDLVIIEPKITGNEKSESSKKKQLKTKKITIIESDSDSDIIEIIRSSQCKNISQTPNNKKIRGLVTPKATPTSGTRSTPKRSRILLEDSSDDLKAESKSFKLPEELKKITATTLADLHDLKRYTRIILNIMPSFSKAPRLARVHIRDQVQKWLISELGETFAHECVIWARTPSGQLFATLGIPKMLESSFNEWIKELLKDLSLK